jgi:TPR repeat protein
VAFERAVESAKAGEAQAQFLLGSMFGLGLGCKQDYVRAVNWYRQAATQGLTQAQCNLGFMYGTGRGVPQDFIYAYAWYNISAAGGEELARANRDVVAAKMSPGQLENAQALSRDLFEKIAAESGADT